MPVNGRMAGNKIRDEVRPDDHEQNLPTMELDHKRETQQREQHAFAGDRVGKVNRVDERRDPVLAAVKFTDLIQCFLPQFRRLIIVNQQVRGDFLDPALLGQMELNDRVKKESREPEMNVLLRIQQAHD